MNATTTGERAKASVSELVGDVVEDLGIVARAELRLAQTEVAGNLTAMRGPVLQLVGGAVAALAALVVLMIGLARLLHPLLGAGIAELVVGTVVLVTALIVAWSGSKTLRSLPVLPQRAGDVLARTPEALRGRS